jgi:hypothetical protein
MGDETFAEVTVLPVVLPATWTPTTAFNARLYPDVEVQVIGTPTTPYVFQDSFDGTNFNDCLLMDKSGTSLPSITSAGRFRMPGSCYLRARQGAGATIYIRAGS